MMSIYSNKYTTDTNNNSSSNTTGSRCYNCLQQEQQESLPKQQQLQSLWNNNRYQRYKNNRLYCHRIIIIVVALFIVLYVQYKTSIVAITFISNQYRDIYGQSSSTLASSQHQSTAITKSDINIEYNNNNETNNNNTTWTLDATSSSDSTRPRILIAQYTANRNPQYTSSNSSSNVDIYEQFLQITSKINIAYTIQYQYDFWIMRGIAFSNPQYEYDHYISIRGPGDIVFNAAATTTNHTEQHRKEWQQQHDVSLPIYLSKYYTIERHVINGQRQRIDYSSTLNTDGNITNDNVLVPESRATYNKITLIELALSSQVYDGILVLDADAMIFNFDFDIGTQLLHPNYVLMAHRTTNTSTYNSSSTTKPTISTSTPHTGSINVGVTLWNLRHPLTPYVVQRWKDKCIKRIIDNQTTTNTSNNNNYSTIGNTTVPKLDDDQAPLQYILKYELDDERRAKVIYALDQEFFYARGTIVKHFIRPPNSDWNNNNNSNSTPTTSTTTATVNNNVRYQKMIHYANEVCTNYHPICED